MPSAVLAHTNGSAWPFLDSTHQLRLKPACRVVWHSGQGRGSRCGVINVGAPADLMNFEGRTSDEVLSRSQNHRIGLRRGHPIHTAPPDYRELADSF